MSTASSVMGAGLRTGEEEEGAPSLARSETVQVGPELKGPLEIDDGAAQPEPPAPVTKNEDCESGTSDGGSDASVSSSTSTVSCHALSSGEEAIADSVGGRAHGLTSMFSPILAEDIECAEADADDGAVVGGSMEASALLLNLSGVTDNQDAVPLVDEGARSSSEFNTPDTSPTMPEVEGADDGGAGAPALPPATTLGGGAGAAAPPPATTPSTVPPAEDAAEAGGDEKPAVRGVSPARPGRLSNLYQATGKAFDIKDGDGVGDDERIDRVVNSLARAVANHGAECQGEHDDGASPGAADVDVTSEVAAALRDAGKDVDEVVARIVSLIPERGAKTCSAIAVIVQRMNGLIVATAQKTDVVAQLVHLSLLVVPQQNVRDPSWACQLPVHIHGRINDLACLRAARHLDADCLLSAADRNRRIRKIRLRYLDRRVQLKPLAGPDVPGFPCGIFLDSLDLVGVKRAGNIFGADGENLLRRTRFDARLVQAHQALEELCRDASHGHVEPVDGRVELVGRDRR